MGTLWALRRFHRKGAFFFTVKGPCALPKFHTVPPPAPPHRKGGGGTEIPVGGLPFQREGGDGAGGEVSVRNLGSARGPFTVKQRPFRPFSMKTPSFLVGAFPPPCGLRLRVTWPSQPSARHPPISRNTMSRSYRKGCMYPKGPKIEKYQSRLKISISREIFNL